MSLNISTFYVLIFNKNGTRYVRYIMYVTQVYTCIHFLSSDQVAWTRPPLSSVFTQCSHINLIAAPMQYAVTGRRPQ